MADGNSPLNMGAPWDAISGLGGGPSQGPGFGQELARAFQPQQGPSPERLPGQEELQTALANMRDFQSRLVVQNQQNEQIKPPATIKVNTSDGTLDLGKVPIETYQAFMRDRQQLDEIRGAFHQEATRLQNQENQVRQQPWAQLATALSANLANQPDMPGWVRGLGQTAAQLNPTADQLAARKLGVLGEEARITERMGGLDIAAATREQALQDRKMAIEAKAEADRTNLEKDVSHIARTVGQFDPQSYVKEMVAKGMPISQATASAERLDQVAKATAARIEKEDAVKAAKEAFAEKKFYDSLAANAANVDKQIAASDRRTEAMLKRGETQDAAKAAKEMEPSPVLKKQLADLNSADTALDEIEKLLKDPANQAIMGPVAGRMASAGAATVPGLADPAGRVAMLKQKLMLQTAQAIKATGAGARGFGPQERPYFEQLSEGINRTPEQNMRIIEGWRQFLDQERRGAQVANPDVVKNPKYASVWGKRLSPQPEAAQEDVWTPEKVKALREKANGR